MKSLFLLIVLLNFAFAQSEFPNLGNKNHFIEKPDSNLIHLISEQGIYSYDKETFMKNVESHFGSYESNFVKTVPNIHTDEMDTLWVINVNGFKVVYLETLTKILILNMTLKENIDTLKQIRFHQSTMTDVVNLFSRNHVFSKTKHSVTFATFGDLNQFVKFIFDSDSKLTEIQWTFSVD